MDDLKLSIGQAEPGRYNVYLGDVDISGVISRLNMQLRPGQPPEVIVTLRVPGLTDTLEEFDSAQVQIPELARQMLIQLGWTPPVELLIDPDCAGGKCGSCVGGPCQHKCHTNVKCDDWALRTYPDHTEVKSDG